MTADPPTWNLDSIARKSRRLHTGNRARHLPSSWDSVCRIYALMRALEGSGVDIVLIRIPHARLVRFEPRQGKMYASVRCPSLSAERRMIHVGFPEAFPTACMTEMRRKRTYSSRLHLGQSETQTNDRIADDTCQSCLGHFYFLRRVSMHDGFSSIRTNVSSLKT